MNEKDLEFGELNLDDIMKEFGADVDASDADLEDTQDLLAAIDSIEEMTAEQESDPEETENQEPEQEAAEEPAAEEAAEPAEPTQSLLEEPVEETQEMDDTVRLDDLSQITGTTPSVGHKLEDKTERLAFSTEQLLTMWENIKIVPDLKYVLILCYTGMRLGEMLGAKTATYNKEQGYFVTGSKTEAGKDRIITIAPQILPFFDDFGKGEYLFFDGKKPPTEKVFRNNIFYPALQGVGMDVLADDGSHIMSPHCCRHTFATMMKDVDAPNTDK